MTDKTLETELFHRGKQVLGATGGGLIVKLLRAKNNNIAIARAAIELASTKQNPREYIGAVIRGGEKDEMGAAQQSGYGDDWW
jgi:hypothetical protein